MDKNKRQISINILIDDFKKDLTLLTNNSGLPISVLEMIFKDYYMEVKELYNKQLKLERNQLSDTKSD